MTDLDIEPIKARALAATPGPWDIYRYRTGGARICIDNAVQVARNERKLIADMDGGEGEIASFYNEGDREFLYHAISDIPALLAEVETLRQRIRDMVAVPF